MKFCPECGKKREVGINKCNCGFEYYKNKNRKDLHTPKEEDIKDFNNARNSKRKKYALITTVLTIILSIIFTQVSWFIIIFGIICLVNSINIQLTAKQYYKIKGTENTNGEHQCIFCGNRGIYRSTIYKTNTVQCKCSKCKNNLFNE